MSVNRHLPALILVFLCFSLPLAAQHSRKELEKKRKQQEGDIKLTKKILSETRNKKKKSLTQLNTLNRQIKIREELINTVADEVTVINSQISTEQANILTLEGQLKKLKDEYAEMIFTAYKNQDSDDMMAYVLSSDDINQAAKRVQYMKQISLDRERQLALIKSTQDSIKAKVDGLLAVRREKNALLGIKETEKVELEEDKKENSELLKTLQQKEKELKKELAAKEKAAKELNRQLKKLIDAEIKPKGSSEKKAELTPEAKKLATDFKNNKGGLPWPVEKGFISKHFGTYAHPELRGITIVNNGIDISSSKGAYARAVFGGEVRAIFPIPNMQKAVMIKHGSYFTVYAHLDQVLVNRGDKVTTKQSLGLIYTDDDDGKTELHFEMWEGENKMDPEKWLAPR